METIELTKLIHTTWDGKSALRLYIYDHDGYHRGGVWFEDVPKYQGEEITTAEAMELIAFAMTEKREIRICDSGDFLVFHSINGSVHYDGGFTKLATGGNPQ